jgi:hypothetical protein
MRTSVSVQNIFDDPSKMKKKTATTMMMIYHRILWNQTSSNLQPTKTEQSGCDDSRMGLAAVSRSSHLADLSGLSPCTFHQSQVLDIVSLSVIRQGFYSLVGKIAYSLSYIVLYSWYYIYNMLHYYYDLYLYDYYDYYDHYTWYYAYWLSFLWLSWLLYLMMMRIHRTDTTITTTNFKFQNIIAYCGPWSLRWFSFHKKTLVLKLNLIEYSWIVLFGILLEFL